MYYMKLACQFAHTYMNANNLTLNYACFVCVHVRNCVSVMNVSHFALTQRNIVSEWNFPYAFIHDNHESLNPLHN